MEVSVGGVNDDEEQIRSCIDLVGKQPSAMDSAYCTPEYSNQPEYSN